MHQSRSFFLVSLLGGAIFLSTSVASAAAWNVIYTPPVMVNPITLYVPNDAALNQWPVLNGQCTGLKHELFLDNSKDYIVRMKPGAAPLTKPLTVYGGKNVRMIGLAIDLQVQPGCAKGDHRQPGNTGGWNIHPLIPGGNALYLEQSGVSYVEGAHIKLNGHEGDCFVGRNPPDTLGAVAFGKRDYVIQNTRCEGIEGSLDYIHGDVFQQQGTPEGGEVTRNLTFENVTGYSSYEGIVHETNNSVFTYGVKKFVARRFNYVWDPVYGNDDVDDDIGRNAGPPAIIAVEGAKEGSLANVTLTDYWVKPWADESEAVGFYVQWSGSGPWGYRSYGLSSGLGLNQGRPPGGDFAPANLVGLNYVSPHDAPPPSGTP